MTARPLIGVNLAGWEYGGRKPGRLGYDYVPPTIAQVDYFARMGMKILRIPVLSCRFTQPMAPNTFVANPAAISTLMAVIDRAAKHGIIVVIDLHEYALLDDGTPMSPDNPTHVARFKRLWRILAAQFRSRSNVWFGLMNEPNKQTPAAWVRLANAAIASIAEVAPKATVSVSGSYWGTADGWISSGNGAAMGSLIVPATMRVLFEAHAYFDGKGGKPETSAIPTPENNHGKGWPALKGKGCCSLQPFGDWLREHGKQGWIGEFGFTPDPAYTAEGVAFLDCCQSYADVIVAVADWSANPWAAKRTDRPFNLDPKDYACGPDAPQIEVLRRYVNP